jgi:tetratricopeptide (TPR) repeat protein
MLYPCVQSKIAPTLRVRARTLTGSGGNNSDIIPVLIGVALGDVCVGSVMRLRALLVIITVALVSVSAGAKSENWLELQTPHFIVLTDSGEKQARHVADQFERMRAVFHKRFPNASVDAASPMTVIAVKGRKDFQALEPQAYLAKGQLDLAGLFLQTTDKNYILVRLDAEGDHPFATVYHEYTHFVVRKAGAWLPLWLNEGWAQFYENTEIKDKEVGMGEPSVENLKLLRQNRLLPLATLLAVDHNSPYYHEENKGSIFYAEAWALTHYLTVKDYQDKTDHLTDYVKLVISKVDPVMAATRAFGDLTLLERALSQYVSQGKFYYIRMPGAIEVDDATFRMQSVTLAQADAVRADFLAYNERVKDSRALLDHVLKDDPKNVSACETMGFLAFREGNLDEAEKWYGQAVTFDSQSFLAHYYFAAIAMRQSLPAQHNAQVETSLRSAIKMNPSFAPAFDQLASFYGMQHANLEEAAKLNLAAVQLDPGNVNYRVNRANLFLELNRPKDAIAVLQGAMKLSDNLEHLAALQNQLQSVQRYQAETEAQAREFREDTQKAGSTGETSVEDDQTSVGPAEPDRHGPRRSVRGTLKNVQCTDRTVMKLKVEAGKNVLELRAANYYKVEYSALNFKPRADLNPCKDLEGMMAKVEYFEALATGVEGQIISIEFSK